MVIGASQLTYHYHYYHQQNHYQIIMIITTRNRFKICIQSSWIDNGWTIIELIILEMKALAATSDELSVTQGIGLEQKYDINKCTCTENRNRVRIIMWRTIDQLEMPQPQCSPPDSQSIAEDRYGTSSSSNQCSSITISVIATVVVGIIISINVTVVVVDYQEQSLLLLSKMNLYVEEASPYSHRNYP